MKYAIIAAVAAVAVAAPAEWDPVKTTTTTDEWEAYKTTTTSEWEYKPTTTYEWEPVKSTTTAKKTTTYEWEPVKPTTTKCSSVSTYTTKVYNNKDNEWEGYSYVTKYTTLYPEKCPATTTSYEWEPVKSTTTKCSSVSAYTTKVYNNKDNEWEGYSYVTKYTTVYPTYCPTTSVKSTETWYPYSSSTSSSKASETSVKSAETWSVYASSSTKTPVAASSTASTPVATYKGAADKSTFGMGALAIAAVAALL